LDNTYDNNQLVKTTVYDEDGKLSSMAKYTYDSKGRISNEIIYDEDGEMDIKYTYKYTSNSIVINEAYDALIKQSYFDDTDALDLLCDYTIGNKFFSDRTIFIDGFRSFSKQEFEVLDVMLSQADDVYITICSDEFPGKYTPFYYTKNFENRIRTIASKNNVVVNDDFYKQSEDAYPKDIFILEKNLYSEKDYFLTESDGSITIADMTMETRYIFVILEKEGALYSPVGYKSVNTLAADLGDIVREGTAEWNAQKARISFEWEKDKFEQGIGGLMSYYSFWITCPKEFTAYIMCASENYFTEMGLTKVEHHMIELENFSSRRLDKDHTVDDENGEMVSEPDYYKNNVLKPGQLMSVNDFYVHGNPNDGAVTYFASDSHGEGNCISWETGVCAAYERALEKIAYYSTIEPYQSRAEMFGLTGKEAEDWSKALLDAYSVYYGKAKPMLYVNDGSPLHMVNPYATGKNEDQVIPDRVIVMLKDLQGNYYEPMYFEVPDYFEK
jgi:hypothetical protein